MLKKNRRLDVNDDKIGICSIIFFLSKPNKWKRKKHLESSGKLLLKFFLSLDTTKCKI